MTLRLDDKWIWDFWFAEDRDTCHVFYLQAPREIGDPDERHWNVSIGHAVSRDLRSWTVIEDALAPSATPAFDDHTTWTGSIIRHDSQWAMLYTGTSKAEQGRVQRVGLATSDDLVDWTRRRLSVCEADARFYETEVSDAWHEVAWRDPWVFADPEDGHFHIFVTARCPTGATLDRGVIGHARSLDLITWETLPPVTQPLGFGHLEVPQLVELESRWYLVFTSDVDTQSPDRRRTGPGTGTYYLVGDTRYGPFEMLGDGALEADPEGSTYAGRIQRDAAGTPHFLAWRRADADGGFVGELGDPRPVEVGPGGRLIVAPEPSASP